MTAVIIDSDVEIAKDLLLISVLILLSQKSLPWYQYWYCHCKRPSANIDVDIAIAKDPLLVSILILLLQNTLCWYRYWYCYCITPSSVIDINIAIAYYLSLVLLLLLLLINGLQTIESQTISKKSLLLSPAKKCTSTNFIDRRSSYSSLFFLLHFLLVVNICFKIGYRA